MIEAIAFAALTAAGWLACAVGAQGRSAAASVIAWLFDVAGHDRLQLARENLRNAFPEWTDAHCRVVARRSLRSLLITFLEIPWLASAPREEVMRAVQVHGIEPLRSSARGKGGMIFLSAHFGNWELAALGGALHFAEPVLIVVKEQRNPRVTEWLRRFRTRFENRIVPMTGMREIIRTVEGGGIIALLADQSATQNDLFVEFFGRPAATYAAPAALALRFRIPIMFGVTVRKGPGLYVYDLMPVPMDDLQGDTPGNVFTLTQRHVRLLEDAIRRHPDQWLWLHRRWKHSA
jgi:KDO2-lipid IV(A) lauroyltransferase